MTDLCTIGPVSVAEAHILDDSSWSYESSATQVVTSGATITNRGQYGESYSFAIICTVDEALQLKGVVEQGDIIWMNTATDLTDNDYLQHKGWVILTSLGIEELNPSGDVQCTITYIKISDYESEYLTMDYSRGLYDGINIEPTYDITSTVYQLNEDGSDITTNWTTARDYLGTLTASVASGAFSLSQAATSDGTWSFGWLICDTTRFTPPFTVEAKLDYSAVASSTNSFSVGVGLTPVAYQDGTSTIKDRTRDNWIEFNWHIPNSTATKYSLRTKKSGKWVYEVPNTTMTKAAGATIALKMVFDTAGNVRTYIDGTQIYYGPHNLSNTNNMFLYLYTNNKDSTARAGIFDNIKVYNADELAFPNVVMIPPDAANLSVAATGTRTVEDGTASYYADPTSELRYQIDKAKYYQGSVKLLSTNNAASSSRQVLSTGAKLTPTTTTLKNGMTQLTFDADEVILSAYHTGAWNAINRFELTADIDYIRPIFISNERVVLQINDTKWTMLRSSPIVTVEHPDTDFDYTLHDRYYHNGALTSAPGAAADIAMTDTDDGYYAYIYDNGDTHATLITKKDPTTIKSDNLPADTITGLGWVLIAGTTYDAPDSLARQWYKQTRTGISLKQII